MSTLQTYLYGELAELTGSSRVQVEYAENIRLFQENLLTCFPELKRKKFVIAVNNQIATAETKIEHGDKIDCMPPFSGG